MNDCDCLYANHPQNQQQQQQVTMENGFGGQNNFTPIQNVFNDTCHTIASRIEELDQFVGRAESHMREMFEKQEDLNCLQHEYLRLKEWLDRASKKPDTKSDSTSNKFKLSLSQKESLVRAQQQQHHFLWENWQRSLDTIFKQALQIQTEVLANVDYFKMAQQWSGNGVSVDSNLDHIQSWCERLIDMWLKLLRQINLMHLQPNSDPKIPMNFSVNSTEYYNAGIYQRWRTQIENVVGRLVKSTFIVDKQPPQVLKTNTRFPCSVRSLIGSPLGNTHGTRPMVRVTIVNETQARAIVQAEDVKDIKEASGAILNREAPMEYHPGTKQYTASFRTMTLKKIQRTEKKGTESVMDEKFALLFQSMFKVAEGELVYYVKVLSLPVVVIVHGNQENHAWATVTWDNAFASEKRVPFVVPDRVEWERVGHVLNLKFKAAVGSEMTPGDIRFLACKVFRNFDLAEYNKLHLSWAQFSKEPLPDRNFTFWEWFYSLMKLTRDHLKELWNADNRCIYGFISRKQTEEVLATKPEGTFLLRYSETELGSITIAYTTVKTDMKPSDSKPVLHIKPWGQKDFQIRPLADRIKDLKHLKYLYPDIPKDQAFGNFYEPNPVIDTSCEGYVPPVLVTHIPEWAVNGGTDSFPNTPHSSLATHSPMTDLYNDPPNSVGSVPHDVPINSSEISHFQDVDFLNLIADVDYDMDDIPTDYDQTELSGAGMNQLFVNGLS